MKLVLEPKELLTLNRINKENGMWSVKDKNERSIVGELDSYGLVWKHPQEGWDTTILGKAILKENGF